MVTASVIEFSIRWRTDNIPSGLEIRSRDFIIIRLQLLHCFIMSPYWAQLTAVQGNGEGEGEVAFFSAKRWDRRNRADLIESATPCHDAQVVGPYRDSNPLRLTILAAMSEDYTTAPQHLQSSS